MDPFAAPATEAAPAAQPPASSVSPEIEAVIAQRVQELSDRRASGLQSLYDKKLAEMGKELARVRSQALGEPDVPDVDEATRRIQELEQQNALLRAAQQYPKAAPAYEGLMMLESLEARIAYLQDLLDQREAASAPPPMTPTPQPVPELVVPDVDMNRPAPAGPGDISNYGGVQMTDQLAADILASMAAWPTR